MGSSNARSGGCQFFRSGPSHSPRSEFLLHLVANSNQNYIFTDASGEQGLIPLVGARGNCVFPGPTQQGLGTSDAAELALGQGPSEAPSTGRPVGTGPCRWGHLVPAQRLLFSVLSTNAVESGSHGAVCVMRRGQGRLHGRHLLPISEHWRLACPGLIDLPGLIFFFPVTPLIL